MDIKFYNTLSGKKETFKPINKGEVRMYNCGPTVYDRAHVGNLRSYVFADLIRRTLEYAGYKVHQVINITDVGHLVTDADSGDDKMTKALKREGLPLTLESMNRLATHYFEAFVEDLKALNVELPAEFPRASEHIDDDIEIIERLEKNGYTYKISDGIYFDTSKFPSYGKLGKRDISGQQEGARVAVNVEKRNPSDFALWKFDAELGWESPWGKGFPGWHIECSAMSRKYLGQPFDIHTGGIDHIATHHNNEIAQSEAAYDVPLANFWMHNDFLTMHEGKMAKSLGNTYVLDALRDQAISPLSYRYWLLTAHYRSKMDFSFDAISAAQTALIRLLNTVASLPSGGKLSPNYIERFKTFIYDDIDTPQALALAWDMLKDESVDSADKKATLLDFDRVFGLGLASFQVKAAQIPEEITALAKAREDARKKKDYVQSDALRKEIEERGFTIKDTDSGFELLPRTENIL